MDLMITIYVIICYIVKYLLLKNSILLINNIFNVRVLTFKITKNNFKIIWFRIGSYSKKIQNKSTLCST